MERLSLFAICSRPISRNKFIFSAVLPSLLLGVCPLVILCLMPVSMVKINTLLWTAGSVGLTTFCQDYVVALYAIFHIPHHAMVQSSRDGLNYFEMK
ncbi:metalloprotease family protein [Streptococcus chenjunshii]|uniref:metalloprotease family protein n=1 Tax=Streptococcus chenjunshii TaxID=2173853 RepID=UPI0035BC7EF9